MTHRAEIGTPLPPSENKLFYPAIDGLRAVAVTMVFFQHYRAGMGSLFSFGWMGVDIFFVLSGFLITGILFDSRNDDHRFENFYARRMLRIFPLYYGIFALLLLTTPLMRWDWHGSWLLWLSYLGNLPGQWNLLEGSHLPNSLFSRAFGWNLTVGHLWSLCVEEQFYLLWPMLVFLVKNRVQLRNLCLGAAICVPVLRTSLMLIDPARYKGTPALYFGISFQVDSLLIGAAAALMLRGPEGQWLLRMARRILASGFAVWVALWLFGGVALHEGFSASPYQPWIEALGYTIVDVMAAGLVLLAIQPRTRLYGWLSRDALRRLGQISYGFYVFHEIPHLVYLHLAQRLIGRYTSHTAPLEALIAGVCTYALAYLSFRFYESPFLRLKDRFTNRQLKGTKWPEFPTQGAPVTPL